MRIEIKRRAQKLKSSTARDFSGGLNVVDSELNLSSKYARVMDNTYRGLDGSIEVRQGTKKFVDLEEISDGVQINGKYFAGYLISVNSFGQVFATDGSGLASRVWDADVAAARRFGLTTWGVTDYVAFEEFGGQLTVHNGQDKPLVISNDIIVDYLADPATGSNFNVPIGRIVCKYGKHLIVANGSVLNVSDEETSGVWTGDPGTLFAGIFDLRTQVSQGPTDIIGLSPFRGTLLVHFKECTIPVRFIKTTDTVPVLAINDAVDDGGVIDNYGAVSARSIQNLGDGALACDIVGVTSISLATFTQTLSPDRPSRLVDPLIKKSLAPLDSDTMEDSVFAQYDRLASMYMLFIPDTSRPYQRVTKGYGYRYIDKLNITAWNVFRSWNWAWSARSSEGLVFFGQANSNLIFVKGDEQKLPLYADFIGDQEVWSDGTAWNDGLGWTPVSDIDSSGVPIKFAWEIPWSDMKNRGIQKTIKYLTMDAQGSATFTAELFIDNKYEDKASAGETWSDGLLFTDGTGFTSMDLDLTPALSIDMVGSDYGGFGMEPYGDIYGGGRNTAFTRNIPYSTKYMLFKMRFSGETMRPLKIVGITPHYMEGSIRRNSDV